MSYNEKHFQIVLDETFPLSVIDYQWSVTAAALMLIHAVPCGMPQMFWLHLYHFCISLFNQEK